MNLKFTPLWLSDFARGPWIPRAVAVAMAVIVATALAGSVPGRSSLTRTALPTQTDVDRGAAAGAVSLHPADAAPEAAPLDLAQTGPLQPHEVFGYAPYWTLPQSADFDVASLTTVAYFGVDVNADGSVAESGAGWVGLNSQELVDLVNRAHRAHDRVVLTAKNFDQGALDRLSSDQNAAGKLAAALIPLIQGKNLDGANLDFEGGGGSERSAFAAFVRGVANALHAVNPRWQVTVDTYASSAWDTAGWFDVSAMAPSVDAFFVAAYDMYDASRATPNSPLSGYTANVDNTLASFGAAVGGGKVILGLPFYGYDWRTVDNSPNATGQGSPKPMSYSQIKQLSSSVYWDPIGSVPWSAYQTDGSWHEVYFDNPTSLALKARAALRQGFLGVGIWALGMDGNDQSMMQALVGNARLIKPGATGPGAIQPSAPAPTKPPTQKPAPTPAATPKPSPSPSRPPSPHPSPILPLPTSLSG